MTDDPRKPAEGEVSSDLGSINQGERKPDLHPDEHGDNPQTDNERLDEGLEETFPASDPVAAKHIT